MPKGYGKSLIIQLPVLPVKRAGNYASLLVITPLVRVINDQIREVKTMNLIACNLAQKLVRLEEVKEDKFDVFLCISGKCHRYTNSTITEEHYFR